MVNEKLASFIRGQLSAGVTRGDLLITLVGQEWSKKEIDEAFAFVEESSPVPFPKPVPERLRPQKNNTIGAGKRIAFAVCNLCALFVTYTVLVNISTLAAGALYGVEKLGSNLYWVETIGSGIVALLLTRFVGRYFGWNVFSKEAPRVAHRGASLIFVSALSILVILSFVVITVPSTVGHFYKPVPSAIQ